MISKERLEEIAAFEDGLAVEPEEICKMASELLNRRQCDEPLADDGWIPWTGRQGYPLELLYANVTVRYADGSTDSGPPPTFSWTTNCGNPIVAYRVIKGD